ncbi:hypothetical protein T439DRAFT_346875 [Meredithblackwellia eburnea MCA 4105]
MRSFSNLASTLTTLAMTAALLGETTAHMSIWTRSMYGVSGTRTGMDWNYPVGGDPVVPIGPGLTSQSQWWFRGPMYNTLPPPAGEVTDLPAGGTIMLEIACHIAWTSYGWSTTVPGSALDACPGGTAGPFHSGDPNSEVIDDTQLAGCALAIADVDDITKVTMDNLVIFSVQPQCVKQKQTTFDIPAMMPKCTGSKCICGWFWLAQEGTANFYMTAFDCSVSNVNPAATAIAPPQDAVFCANGYNTGNCTSGAKRPLYAYNSPTNVVYPYPEADFNANRPGYHASWSFQPGAQNDIFLPAASVSSSAVASSSAASSSVRPSSSSVPVSSSAKASSSSSLPASTSSSTPTPSSSSTTSSATIAPASASAVAQVAAASRMAAISARKSSVAARLNALSSRKAAAKSKAQAAKTSTTPTDKAVRARRTIALTAPSHDDECHAAGVCADHDHSLHEPMDAAPGFDYSEFDDDEE